MPGKSTAPSLGRTVSVSETRRSRGLDLRRLWHHKPRRRCRSRTIADLPDLEGQATSPAVSLLFAAGERPRVRAVVALADGGARVLDQAHRAGRAGGRPRAGRQRPGVATSTGLAPERGARRCRPASITHSRGARSDQPLRPGPHLGGAAGMMAVWRTFALRRRAADGPAGRSRGGLASVGCFEHAGGFPRGGGRMARRRSGAVLSRGARGMSAKVLAVASDGAHRFAKVIARHDQAGRRARRRGRCARGRRPSSTSRAWHGTRQRPSLRQVHLIHAELFGELAAAASPSRPAALGENITTQGIDLLALPRGMRLRIGSAAVIEVTGLRNPCRPDRRPTSASGRWRPRSRARGAAVRWCAGRRSWWWFWKGGRCARATASWSESLPSRFAPLEPV